MTLGPTGTMEAWKTMKTLRMFALALAAATSLALAQTPIDERRPLDTDGVLSIENIAGSVTVIGWSRNEVEITGTLGKGTRRLGVSGDKRRLSVEVEYDNDHDVDLDADADSDAGERRHDRHARRGHRTVESSDLVIHAPRGATLEIDTVAAGIDVSEVAGGVVNLESVSGDIRVKGSPRRVEVSVVSGDSEVTLDGTLDSGDFESVVGNITVDADLGSSGRFKFETVSGDITLRLPRDVSAEFDLSTFNGKISSDFGGQPRKTSEFLPSLEMSFTTGGGGARVSMETLNGSIRVVRQ